MNSGALATFGARNAMWDTTFTGRFDRTLGVGLPQTVRSPWLDRRWRFLRSDHAVAQLLRFALVGGAANIAYAALFLTASALGPLVANIAGSLVSTAIANEMHRRLTFRAAGRVGWFTAQWEGGGLALVGVVISTAALAGLRFWAPGLGDLAQASAVLAVTGAVGGMRFLALRGFVFSGGGIIDRDDDSFRDRIGGLVRTR
ncbi:GtrA family protein [Nocardia africana]|uniref:GtrA family protein n=1 Tax=Nocardia africana TaxID=134964 RepID=A0ABW6NHI8_9NOCA